MARTRKTTHLINSPSFPLPTVILPKSFSNILPHWHGGTSHTVAQNCCRAVSGGPSQKHISTLYKLQEGQKGQDAPAHWHYWYASTRASDPSGSGSKTWYVFMHSHS